MMVRRWLKVHCVWAGAIWCALISAVPAHAITPDNPGAAAIQFTANSGLNVKSISPYIYGSNSSSITNRTFDRAGGNRWTGYNWENNASNAGSDWYNHSDYLLTNGQPNQPPGAAVSGMIQTAAAAGRAAIITVPMAGYVAADGNGTVDETEIAPSPRWKEVVPKKTTIYPGSSLSNNPDKSDGYVFTDEFVNWAETTKQSGQQLWYSLDNEPGLWGEALPAGWQSGVEPNPCCNPANGVNPSPGGRTHPTIHPYAPTFAEMRSKTIAHATAIKDVNPDALVFGGVGYGWNEFTTLQNAPDAVTTPVHPGGDQSGEMHYYEWLLQQVHNEEIVQGRKLMDVIDLHWYPEATGGGVRITGSETTTAVVNARVQAPRSLWDPTYTETSWISQWGTWVGSPGTPGPVKLLPRLQRDIDDFDPGTKMSITEYNYGGGNHYSGGIAEADVLGTFGRQGVFAAAWWDSGNGSSYVNAAFNIYRNYNGAGGKFGDESIDSTTSNIANSSVYASLDSSDPNRMVIVAINRTGSTQTTGIAVTHDRIFDHAEIYRFNSASAAIVRQADIELDLLNAFQYTMPAWSVTTIVLISDGLPGDFNRDGRVDASDYVVWRSQLGQTGNLAADANEDNIVNSKDYDLWRSNFGRTESTGIGTVASIPEASTCALVLVAGCAFILRRKNVRQIHFWGGQIMD
jgi:hypothetical protein